MVSFGRQVLFFVFRGVTRKGSDDVVNVSLVSVSISSLDFEAKNGERLVSFLALVVSFGEFFVSVGEFDARAISPYRYIAIWAKKRAGFWEILSEVGECGWEWQSWLVVHEAEPRVRA